MFRLVTKNSANFKGLLFVIGMVIIGATFWYSQQVVNILKEKSTEYVRFRIKIFEDNINNPAANSDVGFFFNEVIKTADYPIIYTDTQGVPQSWINISNKIDSFSIISDLSAEDSLFLYDFVKTMAIENDPISIQYQGTVLGYYHYGYPPEIYKIRNLPFIAIIIGTIFVFFAYLGFAYIKRSEQRNIWVGMAKETAHQLGTPLSSLYGWLELIKMNDTQRDTAIIEMGNDLERLNKITTRFSKIGSKPTLKKEKISPIIHSVVQYFQKRLPNLNKQVNINFDNTKDFNVLINNDLFEWVLENLIKNALDAIKDKNGKIDIVVQPALQKNYINIDITDNGKGVHLKNKKNIFKPGFSTKKRGWGLGLSLAKRIIEEYHQGKLILYDSRPALGSTFRIVLKMPT